MKEAKTEKENRDAAYSTGKHILTSLEFGFRSLAKKVLEKTDKTSEDTAEPSAETEAPETGTPETGTSEISDQPAKDTPLTSWLKKKREQNLVDLKAAETSLNTMNNAHADRKEANDNYKKAKEEYEQAQALKQKADTYAQNVSSYETQYADNPAPVTAAPSGSSSGQGEANGEVGSHTFVKAEDHEPEIKGLKKQQADPQTPKGLSVAQQDTKTARDQNQARTEQNDAQDTRLRAEDKAAQASAKLGVRDEQLRQAELDQEDAKQKTTDLNERAQAIDQNLEGGGFGETERLKNTPARRAVPDGGETLSVPDAEMALTNATQARKDNTTKIIEQTKALEELKRIQGQAQSDYDTSKEKTGSLKNELRPLRVQQAAAALREKRAQDAITDLEDPDAASEAQLKELESASGALDKINGQIQELELEITNAEAKEKGLKTALSTASDNVTTANDSLNSLKDNRDPLYTTEAEAQSALSKAKQREESQASANDADALDIDPLYRGESTKRQNAAQSRSKKMKNEVKLREMMARFDPRPWWAGFQQGRAKEASDQAQEHLSKLPPREASPAEEQQPTDEASPR
ncbi:MAG: hypothetical protein AAFV53_19195 [Myxococcota bacterium]